MCNNIYDIFPEDIWLLIILELPCKLIPKMYDVSKEFIPLVIRHNLIEKRKYKGFPRKSGQCLVHDVSEYSGKIYDNNELYYEGNFGELLSKKGYNGPKLLRLISDAVLDKLILGNINLIKGDIMVFNPGRGCKDIFIFDGEKIIGNEGFILFPDEFSVNETSRNYWCVRSVFDCNPMIKFYHRHMIEELINNITDTENIVFTYFYINNIPYVIIMGHNRSKYHDNFKKIILNNESLYLYVFLNNLYLELNFELDGVIVENIYECRGF